jgi:uncharacterized protein
MNNLNAAGTSIVKTHLAFGRLHEGAQISFSDLDSTSWQYEALSDFNARVEDDTFPCLFSKKAFKRGSLLYLFCRKRQGNKFIDLLLGLLEYTQFVRETPLSERLFSPLIVFLSDELRGDGESQHDMGWSALNWLHRYDPMPWPKGVPIDPQEPEWCFCFNGVQLFVNMSSGDHKQLRSRNLGRQLKFVINPRENFDSVASAHTKSGRLVRQRIRSRISTYNNGFVPQELGFYGEKDNLEWTQYQLSEEGLPRPDICPFRTTRQSIRAID